MTKHQLLWTVAKVYLISMTAVLALKGLFATIVEWFIFSSLRQAQAGSIGIIGGADGPTAIFATAKFSALHVLPLLWFALTSAAAWLWVRHKIKNARGQLPRQQEEL